MNLNTFVRTLRFGEVRISAVFNSSTEARECGYTEPTHYRDESWHIRGKVQDATR